MDKLLGRGYRAKIGNGYDENEPNFQTLLIIKLPDSRLLRIMSRSLFLAIFLLALPSLITMMSGASPDSAIDEPVADSDGFKILPVLLRDLLDEGLIKKGHKGFVLGAQATDIDPDLEFLKDAGADLLTGDINAIEHRVFDFVFAPSFRRIQQFDGIVKEDRGLIISPLGHDMLNQLSNYKIVYLRRFDITVVAMRKTAGASASSSAKRVLCGVTQEEKKTALNGLEDVYLEPPKQAALKKKLKKPKFTSRKIKFLPELLKISLDVYPRRIFISDEFSAIDWFYKNYPMRDEEFQIYSVEFGAKTKNDGSLPVKGVSSWLTEHVKLEDYVVMKADAQVVEEMLKDKTLCLVDELFLECKDQWAYWQCLALYGKVRDEGIAVHQWWN